MSKLSKQIDVMVLEFCDVIATKFKLNNEDLYSLWMDEPVKEKEKEDMTPEKVMSATKDYLMAYCKSKGLKQSGKKEEIIQRVIDSLKTNDKEKEKEKKKNILEIVSEKVGVNEIRKNKFGNHEHFESGLLFNDSKTVIGYQNPNGKVESLTDKEIELCKKYKFLYKLPDNLSVNKSLHNVKVDELDEEELDDDDIEEEEELEDEVDLEDD